MYEAAIIAALVILLLLMVYFAQRSEGPPRCQHAYPIPERNCKDETTRVLIAVNDVYRQKAPIAQETDISCSGQLVP